MRKWFALSSIGHDRPGMVADLAEFIYENECNLENSSMSRLGSEFAVLLLLSSTAEDAERRLASGARRLELDKKLSVFIRALDREPMHARPYGVATYEVQASGLDKAGIVARVARTLADQDANILEMASEVVRAAESGTPLYRMSIVLEVPSRIPEADLRHKLEEVAASLHIEVILKRKVSL